MSVRKVEVSGSIKAMDHETFGSNQRETQPVSGVAFVSLNGLPSELVKISMGVGGEVRVELELNVNIAAQNFVRISGSAKLFEGDDENTQDLEHEETLSFQIPPGQATTRKIHLANSGFGGGDTADIELTFTNVEVDVAVAAGSGPLRTRIAARHSGKMLDVGEASTANGALLIQWDPNGLPNQLFHIDPVGGGWVRLVAQHSGKVLDVAGASTERGAPIIQFPWNGGAHQRFRLESLGDGTVRIVAQHSGKVLDVAGGVTSRGAQIIQWDWTGRNNQRFST